MRNISLPTILDQQASRALAVELRDAVDKGGVIILDGSGVESIGLAGLQLLLCALRTRSADGVEIRLDTPSLVLTDVAQLVGAFHDA